MLSDHIRNITAQLSQGTWADLRPRLPLWGSIPAVVAQVLLLGLLLDYSRMLWLRSKMVRPHALYEIRESKILG